MPCMGPDISYVDPMAARLTETIVKTLAEHGYTRPDVGMVVDGRRKWDAEVEKIRESLREMLFLNAADNF